MFEAAKKALIGFFVLGLAAIAGPARAANEPCTINAGAGEFASSLTCASDPQSPQTKLGRAIPTFHSMSLYYNPPSVPTNTQQVFVRYRKATDNPANVSVWKQGIPMTYDSRAPGFTFQGSNPYTPYQDAEDGIAYPVRSSVVMLQPRTKYVFEMGVGNILDGSGNPTDFSTVSYQHQLVQTTWADDTKDTGAYPLAPAVAVPNICPTAQNPCLVRSQSSTLAITVGGSATTGYYVYDGTSGDSTTGGNAVINRGGNGVFSDPMQADESFDSAHGIVVKASFVIIRNVVVKGAAIHGIYIQPGVTDVIIESSDLEDWGYQTGRLSVQFCQPDNPNAFGTWSWDQASAIRGGGGNSRIIIQRNTIKAPHFGSFPWDTPYPAGTTGCPAARHPSGPDGISFNEAKRQNVIRYNEITGADDITGHHAHWYQDGIGGQENGGPDGSPGADSDIYQNIIMNVFDDAIEAEGGGRNVRIWGNYFTDVKTAVAATSANFGPHYAWRNVINRLRAMYHTISNPDDDRNALAFKYFGVEIGYGEGPRYVFNNTLLAEIQSGSRLPTAAEQGFDHGNNGDGSVMQTLIRNNILHVRPSRPISPYTTYSFTGGQADIYTGCAPNCTAFDHNLYNADLTDIVADGSSQPLPDYQFAYNPTVTPPVNEVKYQTGNGVSSVPTLGGGGVGSYRLDSTSKGYRKGAVIPNFSEKITLADGTTVNPDVGAHQSSDPNPMTFGITATTGAPSAKAPIARMSTVGTPDSTNTIRVTLAAGQTQYTETFSDNGSAAQAPATAITKYTIDFGDGSTPFTSATAPSGVAHSYAPRNTAYTAMLTVADNSNPPLIGNTQVFILVTTSNPPTASLTTSPAASNGVVTVNSPYQVSFTGSGSATAPATITQYTLDYGDGTAPLLAQTAPSNVQHTYAFSSNPYTATFTVTDSNNMVSGPKTVQVVTTTTPPPAPGTPLELNVSVNPNLAVNRAAGEGFAINIQATDARTLASISISVDGVLKASNVTSFTWTPTTSDAIGNHVLRVDATDSASPAHTTSESRTVTVLGDVCTVYTSAASVTQGAAVTVQGVCSGTKTIGEMEFYVDNVLQGSDPTSSYTWTVDTSTLAAGSHTLGVKGKFVSPAAEASASTSLTVAAPILALSFSPGTTILPDEQTTITASLTDGRQVKQIDFWIDGAFKQGTIVPPYQYPWTTSGADVGRHTLLVQATDTAGNVLSTTRDLLVIPHTCSVLVGLTRYHQASSDTIYVMPHRVAQGQRVSVRGKCDDWVSITRLEFYLNGVLQSTSTAAPYVWSLDTSALTAGQTYTIATKGYLTNGLVSNDSVTIEILSP